MNKPEKMKNLCKGCPWYNRDMQCRKPKDQGYCLYTKSSS